GKHADAEEAYDEALSLRKKLADKCPEVSEYQSDLASVHFNRGALYAAMRNRAQAEGAFKDSLRLREKLSKDQPEDVDLLADVAETQNSMGILLRSDQDYQGALEWGGKAVKTLQPLVQKRPYPARAVQGLVAAHTGRGNVFLRVGQYAEGLAEWERVL